MFLGKDGDRTIFQIMTRHGVDIGAFSVRPLYLSLLMSCQALSRKTGINHFFGPRWVAR